jgi:hypothetical protein
MQLENPPIFELIALLGIVVGPLIAYFAAKRKIGAEVLLIDINTIKGWGEARREMEGEIAGLRNALEISETKRRADREKYLKKIDELQAELDEYAEKLKDCAEHHE